MKEIYISQILFSGALAGLLGIVMAVSVPAFVLTIVCGLCLNYIFLPQIPLPDYRWIHTSLLPSSGYFVHLITVRSWMAPLLSLIPGLYWTTLGGEYWICAYIHDHRKALRVAEASRTPVYDCANRVFI